MARNSSETYKSQGRKFPLFRRNLKIEELYDKYQQKTSQILLQESLSGKQILWITAVFLFIISIPLLANQLQNSQILRSQATVNQNALAVEAENGKTAGNVYIMSDDITASNSKYIQLSPKETFIDISSCPSLPNINQVTFEIEISKSGKYFFWSRIKNSDKNANSYYLQIDENCPVIVKGENISANSWTWVGNIEFNLLSGKHKIRIVGKDKNIKIDRIILTPQPNCTPILKGENCLI